MGQEIRDLTIADYDEIIRVWAEAGLPFKPKGRDSREMMAKEMANANCKFFGLIDDPLEEYSLSQYSCPGGTAGSLQWHYCNLLEAINTRSVLALP